jgi:putative transposase
MPIRNELLDELLKEYKRPEDLIGEGGLLKELTKRLVERAMEAEMTHHLGYEKHSPDGKNTGNSRNGKTEKTVITDQGNLRIEVPRDRKSDFEPQIIKKGQRRFTGFDDKILSMYARGMTTRDIQGHLQDIYQVEVSPDLISTVTDAVIEEVGEWQSRPIERLYPIVYLDGLVVKVKDQGHIMNKTVYLAIGVNLSGEKDLLGLWIDEAEGAKFWLRVLTELRNRGLEDVLIACVDGLKGFPEAIESVFPKTEVQLCIVHMVRNSLRYVSWKDRKKLASDLRQVYQATTVELAEQALTEFEQLWGAKYPTIG